MLFQHKVSWNPSSLSPCPQWYPLVEVLFHAEYHWLQQDGAGLMLCNLWQFLPLRTALRIKNQVHGCGRAVIDSKKRNEIFLGKKDSRKTHRRQIEEIKWQVDVHCNQKILSSFDTLYGDALLERDGVFSSLWLIASKNNYWSIETSTGNGTLPGNDLSKTIWLIALQVCATTCSWLFQFLLYAEKSLLAYICLRSCVLSGSVRVQKKIAPSVLTAPKCCAFSFVQISHTETAKHPGH